MALVFGTMISMKAANNQNISSKFPFRSPVQILFRKISLVVYCMYRGALGLRDGGFVISVWGSIDFATKDSSRTSGIWYQSICYSRPEQLQ